SAIRLMGYEPPESTDANDIIESPSVQFTPKQQEVFEQLLMGVPNKVIADRLDMAEGTVKTHLHNIYQILRVRNRAQAILRSRQLHLIG
ncbi:MAG TPA: LuxR C-terminal-related transcriptional regulator, partial [Pseudomonadales bacterium]|nr:LuxR C-terminal-related transcriptional regulator [Pseudomonadales bacterium]